MRNENIYIERYQNREINFKGEVTVFDSFEVEEILGVKRTIAIGEEIALKVLNKKYVENTDITRITIDCDRLEEELQKLQYELKEQSFLITGDDEVYDYFEDLVYAFCQICIHFEERVFYNETVDMLNSQLKYEEKDELFFRAI